MGAERYSANVEIELYAGDRVLDPAQVHRDAVIFTEPVVLNETTGELVVKIDGREQRWTLTLRPSNKPRTVVEIETHVPF